MEDKSNKQKLRFFNLGKDNNYNKSDHHRDIHYHHMSSILCATRRHFGSILEPLPPIFGRYASLNQHHMETNKVIGSNVVGAIGAARDFADRIFHLLSLKECW